MLKVYGGNLFACGEQVRVVILARSINQVAYILGETHYSISRMWGETGNSEEIEKAKQKPLKPIFIRCLSRNERNHTEKEFQDSIDSIYKQSNYRRPYIRKAN